MEIRPQPVKYRNRNEYVLHNNRYSIKLFRDWRLFLAKTLWAVAERSRKSLIPLTSGLEFDLCRADLGSSSGTSVAGAGNSKLAKIRHTLFYLFMSFHRVSTRNKWWLGLSKDLTRVATPPWPVTECGPREVRVNSLARTAKVRVSDPVPRATLRITPT